MTTTVLPTCLNNLPMWEDLVPLVPVCEDLTLQATAEALLAMAVFRARLQPLEETMASLVTNQPYITALQPTVCEGRSTLAIAPAPLPICNIFIYQTEGRCDLARRRLRDRIMPDSDKDLVPWSTHQYPPQDSHQDRDLEQVRRLGSARYQHRPNRDTRRKAQHCQPPLQASFPPTEPHYIVLLVISNNSKMDAFRRLLLLAR